MGRKNRRRNTYVKPINPYKYVRRYDSAAVRAGPEIIDETSDQVLSTSQAQQSSQAQPQQPSLTQPPTQSQSKRKPVPHPHRGEIWFARLGFRYGSVENGTRPVLVISNDVWNQRSETYTVVPMTTKLKHLELPTHVVMGARFCEKDEESISVLVDQSMLMVEQITTVDRRSLLDRLGWLTDDRKLIEIENAVALQVGVRPNGKKSIVNASKNVASKNAASKNVASKSVASKNVASKTDVGRKTDASENVANKSSGTNETYHHRAGDNYDALQHQTRKGEKIYGQFHEYTG